MFVERLNNEREREKMRQELLTEVELYHEANHTLQYKLEEIEELKKAVRDLQDECITLHKELAIARNASLGLPLEGPLGKGVLRTVHWPKVTRK